VNPTEQTGTPKPTEPSGGEESTKKPMDQEPYKPQPTGQPAGSSTGTWGTDTPQQNPETKKVDPNGQQSR
jgi:hypothetical protein